MAQPAPNTKDWKAWFEVLPPHPQAHFTVTGEVEVNNVADSAHLKVHQPQGINPKILLLDLTITLDGEGFPKKFYKQVRLDMAAHAGAYTDVEILWEGNKIAGFKVGWVP
jgi:hypothetical protein